MLQINKSTKHFHTKSSSFLLNRKNNIIPVRKTYMNTLSDESESARKISIQKKDWFVNISLLIILS